jgi:gliding motility-associated-like protein
MKKALFHTFSLLGLFLLLSHTKVQAQQYSIIYPSIDIPYCDTLCDNFSVFDFSGGQFIEFVEWFANGTPVPGNGMPNGAFICIDQGTITAVIYDNSSPNFTDTVSIFLAPSEPLIVFEVFSDAFNACPEANGGPDSGGGITNCDVVCAGTTVTYTWEYFGELLEVFLNANPGSISFDFDISFSELSITWDEPGLYSFSIIFVGPCNTEIFTLCTEVLEDPIAAFNSTPADQNDTIYLCQNQLLTLENTSQYASSYAWNFGNGNSSVEANPTISYDEAGMYTITLSAFNDCLCSSEVTKTVVVDDAISPLVDCIGTICENTIATYTSTADCDSYIWSVSNNGIIIDGGGIEDDFLTVSWSNGPEGIVNLQLMDCVDGATCLIPAQLIVPIISDAASIVGDANVCRGEITSYTITPFEATNFDWEVSIYGTILDGQGTNQITVEWFDGNIPGNPDHWVAVSFDNCYLGCGGQDTLDVFINPEFYTTGPLEACFQSNTQHQALSLPGNSGVLCNWEVLDHQGNIVFSSATPSSTFDVLWDFGLGTYQIIAIPDDVDAYCTASYRSVFNVLPLPDIGNNIIGDTLICIGQTYTYEATSSIDNVNFIWEVNDGGNISMLEGAIINYTFTNPPPYALNVYAQDPFGCNSEVIIQSLSGLPPLTIQANSEACIETTTIFTATFYPDLSYTWSITPPDRGTIIGVKDSASVEILWHSPGTADVEVNLCGQSAMQPITINGASPPTVTHPDPICPGTQALVQAIGTFNSYAWYDESDNLLGNTPTIMLFPGTYQLAVTNALGCEGVTAFSINEFPEPEVNISTPDPNVFFCTPISTRLFANAVVDAYDYQWYRSGIAVGTNSPEYTATVAGNYRVDITDENGCTASSNIIAVLDDCGNGPPLPPSECQFVQFDIIPTPTCNVRSYLNTTPGAVSSSWNFSDPASGVDNLSTLANPTHTFSEVGFYRILLVTQVPQAGNPDSLISCATIRVDTVLAIANFAVDTICAGAPATFEDLTTFMSITSITSWQWDFGDPASGVNNTSTLRNPTHTYATPGFYNVTLTATTATGCTTSRTRTVEIKGLPFASFDLPSESCEDIALEFIANLDEEVLTINWDFGDPSSGDANTSTSEVTYHDFMMAGDYMINLETQSIYGCTFDTTQQLTITPNALSGAISVTPGLVLCDGDTAILYAPPGGINWEWDTGASTDSILVTETGTYNLYMTNAEGCPYRPSPIGITFQPLPETIIRLVEFNEFQQAVNYIYNSYEACEGTDVTLQVTDNPNYTYQWSNGVIGTSIDFLEERDEQLTAGSYTFDVTITNNLTGCSNVSTPFDITIHPLPNAPQITALPNGPNCEGDFTTFQVTTPESGVTYTWNNGEVGEVMKTTQAGEYFVTAVNSFGCTSESNQLTILAGPDISLVPNGCYAQCRPDTLCLPPIPDIVSYQWLLDGAPVGTASSTPPEFIATESGAYQLEMQNSDGCTLVSDPLDLELFDGLGNIIGQTWVDVNNNGVIDAQDTLITGTIIELIQAGFLIDDAQINPYGNYSFTNIEADDYTLMLDTTSYPAFLQPYYTQIDTSFIGCDVTLQIDWLLQDLCQPDTTTLMLSACDSLTYNGMLYDQDTSFISSFTSLIGCDSIVEVSIDILESSDSAFVELAACPGDSIVFDGIAVAAGEVFSTNFMNADGCDSVLTIAVTLLTTSDSTLHFSACEGDSVLYQGTPVPTGEQQSFILTNTQGCDSTVTVIVNAIAPSDSTLSLTACEGDTIFYQGTPLLAGEQQTFVLTNAQGCDSTVTVMVNALTPGDSTLNLAACEGDTIFYQGTPLLAGEQQTFVLTNAQGCDSTVTVMVSALTPGDSTLNLTACEGDTIFYQGTPLLAGEQQTFVLTNAQGCDSTVTVMVSALTPGDSTLNLAACEGDTIFYQGTPLLAGEQQTFVLTNAQGCDSTVTVMIEPLLSSANTLSLEVCEGDTAFYQGVAILPGQQEDFILTNSVGCDSVLTVMVNSLATSDSLLDFTACEGDTVFYQGEIILPGEQEVFTLTNAVGCDSIVTVTVESLGGSDTTINLSACSGNTVLFDGVSILAGESADFMYSNTQGCDSIVTVQVLELLPTDSTLNLSACTGGSVVVNGIEIPAGTQVEQMLQNVDGCDSLLTVIVDEVEVLESMLTLQACEGDSASYNGTLIPAGGSQSFTFTASSTNCDSIVTVTVATLMGSTNNLTLSACPGEQVVYNGVTIPTGTQQTFTFMDSQGCDSVVVVSVVASAEILLDIKTTNSCPNIGTGAMEIVLLPGSANPLLFSVDGGNTFESTPLFANLDAGTYPLIAQDTEGCEETFEVTIPADPALVITISADPISCTSLVGQLRASVISGDDGNLQLSWGEDTMGSIFVTDTPGTYLLQASNNCEERSFEGVIEDLRPDEVSLLYVPNAFSPNDDGRNDEFRAYPSTNAIWTEYRLMIFDRWGNMLFESDDPNAGWDGTYKGEPMNNAVHVWHISGIVESCGQVIDIERKGDVVIVR